jgi:metal-dependent amidase/aminoacylase/carboxypeptidase family protein
VTRHSEATVLRELEGIYTDIHAHPELAFQEVRTARIASEELRHSARFRTISSHARRLTPLARII